MGRDREDHPVTEFLPMSIVQTNERQKDRRGYGRDGRYGQIGKKRNDTIGRDVWNTDES